MFSIILLILQTHLAGLTLILWDSGEYSGFWDPNFINVQIICKQRLVCEILTQPDP